VDTNRK